MAKPVVCNAGPLIHLDQLGSLDLLSDFPSISVPETVWAEVTHHRPTALPQPFLTKVGPVAAVASGVAALCRAFSLDAGEAACLALLSGMPEAIFLTDDAAARLVAGNMGFEVHGTIGVLLRSIRTGKRNPAQVLQLLDEIPTRSSLYIDRALLAQVRGRLCQEFGINS